MTVGTEAANNHDPNSAIYLNTDTVYTDAITAEGQENWYYVYVPQAGKLTTVLQVPGSTALDYDLTVFRLDQTTSTLVDGIGSQYGPAMNEQVSQVVQPGYYFVRINGYQGFDANAPYAFLMQYSANPDVKEPDDNIWQAKSYTQSLTANQTLDNPHDQDWFAYTVNEETLVKAKFNAAGSTNDASLDIFNSNLAGLGTLQESDRETLLRLSPGTYYMRVSSASGSQENYSLSLDGSMKGVKDVYRSVPGYVMYTTTNNELKINNNVVPFKWERRHYVGWGSGYNQRTQSISYGLDKMYGAVEFGSYNATYYGSIPNVFRFKVTNVSYMHHRSYYQSGTTPIYESDFSDVLGLRTPRTTEDFDDMLPELGPLHLVVNADTGEVVDFDAGLNFYYYKENWYDSSIESRSFTKRY